MASAQIDYWFRPGRGGGRNPGILAVQNKYEFTAHEVSNNGSIWTYNCKFRNTPKIKCSAKARVTGFDGKWFLQSVDKVHSCEPNCARVIAEHLRHQMKEIVRKIQLKQWVKLSEI